MKLARILLYYKIDNDRTSYFFTVKAQTSLRILHGSRKFCQRGSYFVNVFFLVNEGRDDPNTTIGGPTSARQQTPLKWRFTVVPLMAQH